MLIDPWSSSQVDYDKLVNQFGIKPFQEEINKIKNPSQLMRRGVIFGHRDFNKITETLEKKEPFAVVTGMMPSGQMHIGHKMVVDQLKWYHQQGATLSLPIADMEAYAARGINLEKAKEIAINEYLTNYNALGLDITDENINIYLTSQNTLLNKLTFKISNKTNFNEMKAIYGFTPSTNLAHVTAPLTQVGDILFPQIPENGGPKKVIVPVGIDQDPHIRLTRDIANKMKKEHKFQTPISTYHRFLTGLTGGKMSSSKPNTAIYLNDTPKQAEKKVKTAKTGGRESLKEQKEQGGQPDKCVIYEMLVYHLLKSDKQLKKIHEECQNGTLLCGECKQKTSQLMKEMIEKIHSKQEESKKIAEKILK